MRRTCSPRIAPGRSNCRTNERTEFAEKLKDIVGLYVDPPAHAVVLSVHEKSQIQALDRPQPSLPMPMKPGRAGTMTNDYKPHDPTMLFAALNILDGHCQRNTPGLGPKGCTAFAYV